MASVAPESLRPKADPEVAASSLAARPSLLVSATFPPVVGGSGRWFWELYRRLPRDEIIVAAGSAAGHADFDQTHDLRISRLHLSFPDLGLLSIAGWRRYRKTAKVLRRLVRDAGIGRLHCGRVLPEGWLALSCRRPFACYVHGEELNSTRQSRQLTWMARRVFERAALVIANSHHTARLLAGDWSVATERIAVLSPGVDTARFVPAPPDERVREALGWSGRMVVLTVARLQKRKGHDRLIDAVGLLRDRWPSLLYAIVGEGEERQALEARVAETGLGDNVRFHGALADTNLIPAYQQCDLFALPNRTVEGDFEGFGMVLLEAQACGRPVLAGDSGGTNEALQDGESGVIVDCTLATTLAEAIAALLDDPARCARMGASGRRWTEEHFDFDVLAPRAMQLLARVPLG